MKESDRIERREVILNAAIAVLEEKGYRDATMMDIAQRAAASKETLYSWFGNKSGLFQSVIRRNAGTVQAVLERHLDDDVPLESALTDIGRAIATLLLGDSAIAINRAAISEAQSEPVLAEILVTAGREATLPFFVQFLKQCHRQRLLEFEKPWEAAEIFLGLLLGDKQIRRLLGVIAAPSDEEVKTWAKQATNHFLRIYGGERLKQNN